MFPGSARGTGPGGTLSAKDLAPRALEFVDLHPSFFQVPSDQLVLDDKATRTFGESGESMNIAFHQVIDGIPVDGAWVVFRLSRGNLVQFGVDRVIAARAQVKSSPPLLGRSQAKSALAAWVGGFTADDAFVEDGTLLWVARAASENGVYAGPIGEGFTASLVYRFFFSRKGDLASWRADVDAVTGEIVRFVDASAYASLLKGSIYPVTNCTDPLNCVPGSQTESTVTFAHAAMSFVGAVCSGDGCYTNSAGAFTYPSGAAAAATMLNGRVLQDHRHVRSGHGQRRGPRHVDLGTSDLIRLSTRTPTAFLQPAVGPNNGPMSGGRATPTPHEHLLPSEPHQREGPAYMPEERVDGAWTEPRGGPRQRGNLPPPQRPLAGNDGELNSVTPGLNWLTVGPDVFPTSGAGSIRTTRRAAPVGHRRRWETLLQGQHSCIGGGFLLSDGSAWGNRAGYGTGSALCSGVRDVDYTRFCYHGAAAGCTPSLDPDAPNGSRSGPAPPPNPPEIGTPARYNHMIAGSPNAFDGKSNFYNCGGPESATSCAGPLNHGCHCESLIASQSNWDLGADRLRVRRRHLPSQGPAGSSGWQYMDGSLSDARPRDVAYASRASLRDDERLRGQLVLDLSLHRRRRRDFAGGTPHADPLLRLRPARHRLRGARTRPTSPRVAPPPASAPTLSTCDAKAPVQLSWTSSAGATEYRVLRNTLGCGFGFTPIATTSGGRTYYEDAAVAPGVPYYYTVQPVGASDSCYGQASNCIAVTPASCGSTSAAAPSNVTLQTPAGNQVRVTWTSSPSAASYKFPQVRWRASADPFAPSQVVQARRRPYSPAGSRLGDYGYAVASSGRGLRGSRRALRVQAVTATGNCRSTRASTASRGSSPRREGAAR